MKQVWIAIVFIFAIFAVNFIYSCRIDNFSEEIASIVDEAVYFADTDYEACGKCIEALLEKLDRRELLLYSFSDRSKVDDIELASKAAAEYYRQSGTEAMKHQLLMVRHRMDDLKNDGKFNLKNLL